MRLRDLQESDFDEVAGLIHGALATWYRVNLNSERFGEDASLFRAFPELYEGLDPRCAVVMEGDGRLAGVVFYHPRETHWGVGIVATHPDFAGRGVARRLMEEVIGRAGGMPLRLVSSAMNLDSFSLYTRLGFVPQRVYQDLVLRVPEGGLGLAGNDGLRVRRAEMADVERMADFELGLSGIRREKDFRHLIGNADGVWRMWLAEGEGGELLGFLGAVLHPGVRMLGPGLAVDERVAGRMLRAVLDAEFRGVEALWLVPADCAELVRECYGMGARNVELHLGSVRGGGALMSGVVFPTFMPESG